jgi:hypothetical protein
MIGGLLFQLLALLGITGPVQWLYSELAEGHGISVSEKPDVPRCSLQAGVLTTIDGPPHADGIQVGVDDDLSIEDDLHLATITANFLLVPFSDRFLESTSGRNHSIDAAVILIGFQVGPLVGRVVENLCFHSGIGSVS